MFIAARALNGLAVASNVLNPAIVGDMFVTEQRGRAMSLIMLAPLLGGAVGPSVAGVLSERIGWRNVLWLDTALAAICEILYLIFFRETYEVKILRKRASRLRKETGNENLRTMYCREDEKIGFSKLKDAVLRPFLVLYDSAVLQILSLFGSVAFAYFYVMSTTLPDILEEIYHLSEAVAGVSFISFSKSLINHISVYSNLNRRRISMQRLLKPDLPRQDIHNPPRQKRRHRTPRIPSPSSHHRRIHSPPYGCRIRLDRPKSPTHASPSHRYWMSRIHSTLCVHPSDDLRRRRIREVFGQRNDWADCHEMSYGDVFAVDCTAACGSVWVWCWVEHYWGCVDGFGAYSGVCVQVWRRVEKKIEVYKRSVRLQMVPL